MTSKSLFCYGLCIPWDGNGFSGKLFQSSLFPSGSGMSQKCWWGFKVQLSLKFLGQFCVLCGSRAGPNTQAADFWLLNICTIMLPCILTHILHFLHYSFACSYKWSMHHWCHDLLSRDDVIILENLYNKAPMKMEKLLCTGTDEILHEEGKGGDGSTGLQSLSLSCSRGWKRELIHLLESHVESRMPLRSPFRPLCFSQRWVALVHRIFHP